VCSSDLGEAEDCLSRLQEHHRSREFWTTAIAVTSKTMSFTKAHARYLEYDCIQKAKEADRYRLKNRAVPSEPHIPEPMLAELRDNFGTIQTLLSMLGYPILDPIGRQQAARILQCTGRGADATGEYTEDGLVVFKGSVIADSIVPSAHDTLTPRRANLREAGVIGTEGGSLQFLEDHAFNSPSGAAMVVLGRTANGWTHWTDEQGRALDDLER
jgi:hypothetical protein